MAAPMGAEEKSPLSWGEVRDSIKLIVGIGVAVMVAALLLGVFGGVALQTLNSTLAGTNSTEIQGLYEATESGIKTLASSLATIATIGGIVMVLALVLMLPGIRNMLKDLL